MRILCIVAVLVGVLAFSVPAVSNAGIVWPLSLKMLVTSAMIAPVAFVMGMPFPTGLTEWRNFIPLRSGGLGP